jgi:sec-independent protein translocase protein TatC
VSKQLENGGDGLAEGPEGDEPMSFFDHLAELRKRLVRSAAAIGSCFVLSYAFVDYLTQIVLRPYKLAWDSVQARCISDEGVACLPDTGPQLINLTAFESVLTDIRIAIIASIFIGAPVIFYQLWMFISPGLYAREKRLVVPFAATSGIMFLAGAVFCYFLALPIATDFLLEYPLKKDIGEGVKIIGSYTYVDYVKYATRLLLGFGLMFEFPLAVYFLAKAGMITHKTLIRHWKVMILSFFIIGAILTPPEPVTQVLMALPMTVLLCVSIGVAYIVSKPQLEAQARLEAELAAEAERARAEARERGEDPDADPDEDDDEDD